MRLPVEFQIPIAVAIGVLLPVVVDTKDAELVRNVFNGRPVWYVMKSGKTDLGIGVRRTLFPDEIWGHTFIAKARDGAIAPLSKHPEGDRIIILITHGEGEDIGGGREREVIEKLKRHHIVVFAITLNDEGFTLGLENIANGTGGQAFKAVTPQALKIVFDRIDQMKKVEIRETKPETIDYLEPFLPPALVLLAVQVLALFGLRFTPW